MAKKVKCEHPDDECRSAWKYVGDKMTQGSGYCRVCGEKFLWCDDAKKLVVYSQVKKPLPDQADLV